MEKFKVKINYDLTKIKQGDSFYKKYNWPVSNKFSKKFVKNLVEKFLPIVNEGKTNLNLTLKVFDKWFYSEIIKWYYASVLIKSFKKKKINAYLGQEFEKYNMIINKRNSYESIFKTFSSYQSKINFLPLLVKEMILDIKNNRKISINFKSCFFPSGLCFQHATEEGYFLRSLHPKRFFSDYDKQKLNESIFYSKEERLLISKVFSVLGKLFNKEGLDFNPLVKDYIKEWLKIAQNFFLLSTKRLDKVSLPSEIWISSIGSNVYSSVLAFYAYQKGKKIIAHDHGNGDAYHDQFANNLFEYNFCTHFYSYNKNQAKIKFSEYKKSLSFHPYKKISFIHKKKKGAPQTQKCLKKKIRSVMYVGTAFHDERMRFRPVFQNYPYLDWQLRLLKFLSNKKKVFYKSHPERFQLNQKVLDNNEVNIINEKRFEDCDVKVDCYIIDFISSSTTKQILKSNAVVIYLNPGYPSLSKHAHELLTKRCYCIELIETKYNRLNTDWTNLERILNKEHHAFSYEFYNYYFN